MALTNLGLMTMTGRSNGKTGIMNTTVSFLVRMMAVLLSALLCHSCIKIGFIWDSGHETKCTFFVDGTYYSQFPNKQILWNESSYLGKDVILMRAEVTCTSTKINDEVGADDNGYIYCLGPAIWLCIPQNLKQGETTNMNCPDNALVITKKVIVENGDMDYYSFYSYYETTHFSSLSVTCKKNTSDVMMYSFTGELILDFLEEPRTVKLDDGLIYMTKNTKSYNGRFDIYDQWAKGREQYSYWP